MSAAPDCEFPNPCPVCGNDDDHEEFRARVGPFSPATFCPHPAERGHGTGCYCGGMSRETAKRRMDEILSMPTPEQRLEQRVAALEATVDRLLYPVGIVTAPDPDLTPEQIAELQKALDEVAGKPIHHLELLPASSSLPLLDPETVRALLRESVTVVKPGEVLFYTVGDPNCTPNQIRELQRFINEWLHENAPADTRVLVLPHGEMGVAEPESDAAFAKRLERAWPHIERRLRTHGSLSLRTAARP